MNRRRVGAILTVLAGLWISLSYWFMIPPVVWPLEGPYSWSRVTRAKYSCVSYLMSVEAAKEQAALELGFEDGHVIPEEVVVAYLSATQSWSYTIQPGDTLSHIALHFKTPVNTIIEQSGLSSPNHLQPGNTLSVTNIPAYRLGHPRARNL